MTQDMNAVGRRRRAGGRAAVVIAMMFGCIGLALMPVGSRAAQSAEGAGPPRPTRNNTDVDRIKRTTATISTGPATNIGAGSVGGTPPLFYDSLNPPVAYPVEFTVQPGMSQTVGDDWATQGLGQKLLEQVQFRGGSDTVPFSLLFRFYDLQINQLGTFIATFNAPGINNWTATVPDPFEITGTGYMDVFPWGSFPQPTSFFSADSVNIGSNNQNAMIVDGIATDHLGPANPNYLAFALLGADVGDDPRLRAQDQAALDHFGMAVAISGDLLVVGAEDDHCDSVSGYRCGAAYVFRQTDDVWTEEAKLKPDDLDGWPGAKFGQSVAIDGNVIVAGAPDQDCGGTGSYCGAAYVFRYVGGSWIQEAKLTAALPCQQDYFGTSVSVSGDVVAVGAWGGRQDDTVCDDPPGGGGAAYVFRDSGGAWIQEDRHSGGTFTAGHFGSAVGVDGDVLVVGADIAPCPGGSIYSTCGAAFVFRNTGSSWDFEAELNASDGANTDLFANVLSVSGDAVLIGLGRGVTCTAGMVCRAGYVFRNTGTSWVEEAMLDPGVEPLGANWSAVSLFGDLAAVGADTVDGQDGNVFLFEHTDGVWEQPYPPLTPLPDEVSPHFGASVAVNSLNVLVGAPGTDCVGGLAECGAAYVSLLDCPAQRSACEHPSHLYPIWSGHVPDNNQWYGRCGCRATNWKTASEETIAPPGIPGHQEANVTIIDADVTLETNPEGASWTQIGMIAATGSLTLKEMLVIESSSSDAVSSLEKLNTQTNGQLYVGRGTVKVNKGGSLAAPLYVHTEGVLEFNGFTNIIDQPDNVHVTGDVAASGPAGAPGELKINGGRFVVEEGGSLNLAGPDVFLLGDVDIVITGGMINAKQLTWTNGGIAGDGSLSNTGTILLPFEVGATRFLSTTLNNLGTIKQFGDVNLISGTIENEDDPEGTFGIYQLIDGDILSLSGGIFVNSGQLIKYSLPETGDSTISVPFDLKDGGGVTVYASYLSLADGGASSGGGTFDVKDGAIVSFTGGSHTFMTGDYRMVGEGGVWLHNETTLTINTPATLTTDLPSDLGPGTGFHLVGGTISGRGGIKNTGYFNWLNGTIAAGTVVTHSGAIIDSDYFRLSGTGVKTLMGRLETGPGISTMILSESSTLTMLPGSTLKTGSGTTSRLEGTISGGSDATIDNNGTIRARGDRTISTRFDNKGYLLVGSATGVVPNAHLLLDGDVVQWDAANKTLTGGRWCVTGSPPPNQSYLNFSSPLNACIENLNADVELSNGFMDMCGNQHFTIGENRTLRLWAGNYPIAFAPEFQFENNGQLYVAADAGLLCNEFDNDGKALINGTLTAGTLVWGQFGTTCGSGTINGKVISSGKACPGVFYTTAISTSACWPPGAATRADEPPAPAGDPSASTTGIMTINGDYTQTATGLLEIEVSGLIPGDEYDRLAVTGNVVLAGTLDISIQEGFVPGLDDNFDILTVTGGTLTGEFDQVIGSAAAVVDLAYGPGGVTATFSCDDTDGDGIPDDCGAPVPNPPGLPTNPQHQAAKHRYLSIDPSTNPDQDTVIKVEIAQMKRCQNDPRRGCLVDLDCRDVCEGDPNTLCPTGPGVCGGGLCINSGPCVDVTPMRDRFSTAQAPLAWLVQAPDQIEAGCLAPGCNPGTENCCSDEDWVSRLSDVPYVDANNWQDHDLIHISDCAISPGITYAVYACDPANTNNCSEPLYVATQETPSGTHLHFGDIAGAPLFPGAPYEPPDGFVNVVDVSAWGLTKQNYGTPASPQLHPTMADLHGPGYGIPANYILGLSDQQAIINHGFTWALPWDNPTMLGGVDPSVCPNQLR